MNNGNVCLILISAVVAYGQCQCSKANWSVSFDTAGLSSCDNSRLIRGFERSERLGGKDIIDFLEAADCCLPTSNWSLSSRQTKYADWWVALDSTNKWVSCPRGYFLQGLYRTSGYDTLSNIEEGRCSKPASHPNYYGHCYTQDITLCFDDANLCECNEGYFVTGLYKGICNELYCLEKLQCCRMASGYETLDELSKVKTFVMDTTMFNVALLSNYLGYSYCFGCGAENTGEDFIRQGDSWAADKLRLCVGYKSDQRLSMDYRNWGFILKDVKFGDPVIEALLPEIADSGTFYNYDQNEGTKSISRSETLVTSVTHTKTSNWKVGVELGIGINFFIGSSSFTFSYENSQTTEDSTHKETSRTFEITTSKTLPGNSSASWRLMIVKTRRTVPYTVIVLAKFSTAVQGFLRSEGGYNGDNTNFHTQYRGTSVRPTIKYPFGDSTTPFYKALKQQSETNSLPWMWTDMKSKYSDAQTVIDQLCDENNYAFTLTGQFEAVEGKHVDLIWEPVKTVTKRSADFMKPLAEDNDKAKKLKHVTKAGPDDVPAPRPPPPKVELKVHTKTVPLPRAVPDF